MLDTKALKADLRKGGIEVSIHDHRSDNLAVDQSSNINLRDLARYRGFVSFLKNTIQTTPIGKRLSERQNSATLERLNSSSTLVFLIHGLRQNAGSFKRLRTQLRSNECESLGINYDFQIPFLENVDIVSEHIQTTLRLFPCAQVYIIGHSTGADLVRYAAIKGKLDGPKIKGLVFSASTINGLVPTFFDRMLFGDATDYANPETMQGRANIAVMQSQVKQPNISIIGDSDFFVPFTSAADYTGLTIVFKGFGHISGTGVNEIFNNGYIECLRFLRHQK